jgi:hypothetical protein
MPTRQEYFSPANAFIQGRAARQQQDYNQTRNAMARMEAENAPREMQARNRLLDTQVQSAEQGLSADKARFAYTKLRQALDSGNPKAFVLQNIPDLAAKLGQQGIDLASMDDQQAAQLVDGLARKYAGDAGIAPAAPAGPLSAQGKIGADVRGGYLTQEQGDAALNPGMTPYQRESLDLRRQQVSQSGGAGGQFVTLTPEEVEAEGLPKGTVAQRSPQGKITVIKKPDAAGGGVKLTEGDKRARVTYNSILNAENDISKMTGADTSSGYNTIVGSNPLTRGMQTDEYRKYEAAGLRWAANLLYLKSGATATPDEIRSTWKQFFPQFGDGDEVKAQKEASRLQEIEAVADAFGLDKSRIPKQKEAKQPAQPQGIDEQGYASLPSGAEYRAPDGSIRRKR